MRYNWNKENYERLNRSLTNIESLNYRRLSTLRKQEIVGYLNLKKRSLERWFSNFLNVSEGALSTALYENRNKSRSNPLWKLYYDFFASYERIEDCLMWISYENTKEKLPTLSGLPNEIVREIEKRVLSKKNDSYTYIEAILELCEERSLTFEEIRSSLTDSIRSKLEAIARSRRLLKGDSKLATLPLE